MAVDELPSPASGLFLEVSFRRLLASCEDIVSGTSLARPDLVGNWQRSPVFHHYVETLQEQLADLETSAGSRLPRPLLERYAAHVDSLAAQLQRLELPAFCAAAVAHPSTAAGAAQQAGAPPAATQQQQQQGPGQLGVARPPAGVTPPPPAPVARPPPVQPPPAAVAKPQGKPPGAAAPQRQLAAGGDGGAAGGPAPPPRQQPASGTGQSRKLETHQQLHEDLTEELAGLAAQLKTNTLAIEGRLKERGQLLESTEAALDTSLQKTRESKARATQVHRRGRANFCLTCLVMLVVGVTFAAMYVFIKLTRFAGYRAAAPPAPAAAGGVPAAAGGVPAAGPGPGFQEGIPEYEHHEVGEYEL